MVIVTFLTILVKISSKAIALPSLRSVQKTWMPSDVISSTLEKIEQTQSRPTLKMVISLKPIVKGIGCYIRSKLKLQLNTFLPL